MLGPPTSFLTLLPFDFLCATPLGPSRSEIAIDMFNRNGQTTLFEISMVLSTGDSALNFLLFSVENSK